MKSLQLLLLRLVEPHPSALAQPKTSSGNGKVLWGNGVSSLWGGIKAADIAIGPAHAILGLRDRNPKSGK